MEPSQQPIEDPAAALLLPEGVSAQPADGVAVLLCAARSRPFQDATWKPLNITGLRRYMALSLHHNFMTSPSWGDDLSRVPERCQFLLWQHDRGYGLLVPLLDRDFRSELVGCGGGLAIKTSCGPSGRAADSVVTALVCTGSDPYEVVRRGMAAAVRWMGRGRLRTDKPTPAWVDRLGWCTYDAFYDAVDEPKILQGLEAFAAGGIVPGYVLIDEGWQQAARGYLAGYGVKADAFTDDRLATVVRKAKQDYGVAMVACWQTLFGTARGVDVTAAALAHLKSHLVVEPDTDGATFGVVELSDVPRFFDEYHGRLAADGVGFVKVDFQSALHLMTYDQCGRTDAARIWQYALQDSVAKHFGGQMLNCMSLGSEMVYHTRDSNVTRSSDDFGPGKGNSHPRHVRLNAFNSLWLGNVVICDWDMFWSKHPWGLYHAMGRAVSGGPVYVSDEIGRSDYALLKRLVAADGKLLRCDRPALPTRDILFTDMSEAAVLLKVFNSWGRTGLLGVFHPRPEGADPIAETVGPWLLETEPAERYAAWSASRGFLGVKGRRDGIELTLGPAESDILLLAPLANGFAALGLVEKLNPAPAVLETDDDGKTVRLTVRGGGRFAAFCESRVREVTVDGIAVEFRYEDGLVGFDTGGRSRCRIEIARA